MWLDSRESTLWLHVSGYVGSGSFLSSLSLGVNYCAAREVVLSKGEVWFRSEDKKGSDACNA